MWDDDADAVDWAPARDIAVLGAGFIGTRCVEMLSGDPGWRVRLVTRHAAAPARLAGLAEHRQADALDAAALARALEGCAVVANCAGGDCDFILDAVRPLVDAAAKAGCGRIVHLSTAVVHGQAPPPGCDETTALPAGQHLPYNLAKRRAEAELFRRGRAAGVDVVALRPGIVYGPGSRWLAELAAAARSGSLALVGGGQGLCNAIHVDNVVTAIALAATVEAAAGEAFLLGEGDGTLTWRALAEAVASAVGVAGLRVADRLPVRLMSPMEDRLEDLRWTTPVRSAARHAPGRLAWATEAVVRRALGTPAAEDLEATLLHTASARPGWSKAAAALGYRPLTRREDAWPEIARWLRETPAG